MKQNKKAATLIGCLLTICTIVAALLIGWNHMNEITQGPKSKEEIGYYQWDRKRWIHFQTLQRLLFREEKYETSDRWWRWCDELWILRSFKEGL